MPFAPESVQTVSWTYPASYSMGKASHNCKQCCNELTIASTEDTEFFAPTEAAGLNAGDRPASTECSVGGSDFRVGVAVVERAGLLAASLATTTGDE